MISAVVFVSFIVLFFLINRYKRTPDPDRFIEPMKPILVNSPLSKRQVKEIHKPIFRKGAMAYHRAPRSMTAQEKYLYSVKPNLQYWIDTHGEKILTRSVSDLQSFYN